MTKDRLIAITFFYIYIETYIFQKYIKFRQCCFNFVNINVCVKVNANNCVKLNLINKIHFVVSALIRRKTISIRFQFLTNQRIRVAIKHFVQIGICRWRRPIKLFIAYQNLTKVKKTFPWPHMRRNNLP